MAQVFRFIPISKVNLEKKNYPKTAEIGKF